MSWLKAGLVASAIVLAAFVLLVKVPDYLVRELTGVSRDVRVYLAAGWFVVAFVGLMWALRMLQKRSLRR